MRINVTQAHIDRGLCSDAERCAVAEAVRDVVAPLGWDYVSFNGEDLVVGNSQTHDVHRVPVPPVVQEFAKRFDLKHLPIGPFSFELPVPWLPTCSLHGEYDPSRDWMPHDHKFSTFWWGPRYYCWRCQTEYCSYHAHARDFGYDHMKRDEPDALDDEGMDLARDRQNMSEYEFNKAWGFE